MTLQAMYNSIAPHYAIADQFGALTQSHEAAIKQIQTAHLGQRPNYKVLDLGVGNGIFLEKLKKIMPHASFTGIDISSEMLKHAQEILPLTAIEANAIDAANYLPPHSQDLVLAHFVNAYIPIDTLFEQAKLLTRANGHFSLITTTYESFPLAQKYLADFIGKDTVVSRVVGHYYKSLSKNTTVASGIDELKQAFSTHDFELVGHKRLYLPVVLNSIDDLAKFGIEGTWFLNTASIRMLPKNFLIARLKRLFSNIFTFPYEDIHIIDVILARK